MYNDTTKQYLGIRWFMLYQGEQPYEHFLEYLKNTGLTKEQVESVVASLMPAVDEIVKNN